jgi:diguanylate cyclase
VNDTVDWKHKYRDLLRETDAEESRWRQVELVLRRLVGRLCAAGMGLNPQLDDELTALAAANRRSAPAEELERLAASLTTTIVAVDSVSPVVPKFAAEATPAPTTVANSAPPSSSAAGPPRISRWDSTCGAVGAVLQYLKAEDENDAAGQLLAELANATEDAQLAAIVGRTADLIRARCDSFAQERLKSASVLSEVTQRLGEMAVYLTEAGHATRIGFEDTTSFNDQMTSQIRELSAEASGATELAALRSLVNDRLEAVTRRIADFRAREALRQQEQAKRTEYMHARIADLEREAQDLCRKLDHEKHGARLDPLTRVANRKSFDERFAREIETRRNNPSVMLLWDIDDFKFINDSYGHRAGDRVLQTVANCFVSGLRAEDFVARIGGEEFVILLTGLEPQIALRIANELRGAVEALRFHFRGTPVRVTASCGLTELRRGDDPGAAFDRADSALYRAKREGKNQCIAA